jgi:hypothetical protein
MRGGHPSGCAKSLGCSADRPYALVWALAELSKKRWRRTADLHFAQLVAVRAVTFGHIPYCAILWHFDVSFYDDISIHAALSVT